MSSDLAPRARRRHPRPIPDSPIPDYDGSIRIGTIEEAVIDAPFARPRLSRLAAEDSVSTPTHQSRQPQRRMMADTASVRAKRPQTEPSSDSESSEEDRPQKRSRPTASLPRPLPLLSQPESRLDYVIGEFYRNERASRGRSSGPPERETRPARPLPDQNATNVEQDRDLDDSDTSLFVRRESDILPFRPGGITAENDENIDILSSSPVSALSPATPTPLAPAQVPSPASPQPPPRQPFFDRPQNPDDVRFSAMMAITQSLSTLNQMFPTAWEREGIEAHQRLGGWLAGGSNGPPNQGGERRNCECGDGVDKRYFFTSCRHVSNHLAILKFGHCLGLTVGFTDVL